MQLEEPGQRREGELIVGSGAAGKNLLSEQEELNNSELPVLCLEGGLVRMKDSALSQLRSVNVLNVPREMAGNEFWHQPLVDMAIVPCFESAGGEGCEWLGGPVVDSVSSGLQVGLLGEASRSLTPGVLVWWSSRRGRGQMMWVLLSMLTLQPWEVWGIRSG